MSGVERYDWLDGAVAKMRALGVSRLRDGELEIELWQSAAPPTEGPHVPKDFGKADTCRCGHEDAAHNADGLCLLGCDANKCADTTGKNADEP